MLQRETDYLETCRELQKVELCLHACTASPSQSHKKPTTSERWFRHKGRVRQELLTACDKRLIIAVGGNLIHTERTTKGGSELQKA